MPPTITITADVQVPPRSRIFTEDDAKQVLALLKGEAEGQLEPSKSVGFGEFDKQGGARSAGVALNKRLQALGAPHPYAITTFERDGKIVGVLLNKPAKVKKEKAEEAPKPAPARGATTAAQRARR